MKVCAECGGGNVSEKQWRDLNDGTLIEACGDVMCWDCGDSCEVIDADKYEKREAQAAADRADWGDDLVNECKAILLGERS